LIVSHLTHLYSPNTLVRTDSDRNNDGGDDDANDNYYRDHHLFCTAIFSTN